MSRASSSNLRHGLSLIEVMACVLIASILSAVALVSARGTASAADLETAIDTLAFHDRLLRGQSRRDGATQLIFDLETGVLHVASQDGRTIRTVNLPEHVRIDRLRLFAGSFDAGEASVPCSRDGRTPSYAMRLAAPGHADQWVLVIGMTGEFKRISDEWQIDAIFTQLAIGGHDAH